MIAAIHQPLYIPWQPYFAKIARSDVFVFLDDVQYPRSKGFFNRNAIKGPQGPLFLTVPVKGRADMPSVREIAVDSSCNWQQKHWKTISLNYAKAPHFKAARQTIEAIYVGRSWERLCDVNVELIRRVAELMGIQTRFVFSSELGLPRDEGMKERLIAILKAVGADQYLTGKGAGSLRYMDEEEFAKNGVRVLWHEYRQSPYTQLWGPFLPDMSIIDLLFNCGPGSRRLLLEGRG